MRILLSVFLVVLGCESLFGTETWLNGGKLVPIDSVLIESSTENLNFCFATRYSDGTIHLNHSKGIHTVTEHSCREISPDNGKTWQYTEGQVYGINSFENLNGEKVQIGCWDNQRIQKHNLSVVTCHGGEATTVTQEIELPYASSFHLHRKVLRLADGSLLATVYGNKEGAKKYHNFVIKSEDDGRTWRYWSDIADDPEGKFQEGPNESELVELAHGELLVLYRVDGGHGALHQKRSVDGGKTWGEEEVVFTASAAPNARILTDGTLVVVTGRPNLYLLVDFTGTGREYQKVMIYNGSGSSYASVLETGPNEIMIIYDESDFGSSRSATAFARIVANRYRLEKNDAISDSGGDPRGKDYTVFYSPVSGKLPQELGLAIPGGYQQAGPDSLTYYEIREIPERPQPVFHIVSYGDNDKVDGSTWSHFSSGLLPESVENLEIVCEFRLLDAAVETPQFTFHGRLDSTGFPEGNLAYPAFARNRIFYHDGTEYKSLDYDVGMGFQKFRILIEGGSGTWKLFHDDETEPIFTARLHLSPDAQAQVGWGDGSVNNFGAVDMSFIGWKY